MLLLSSFEQIRGVVNLTYSIWQGSEVSSDMAWIVSSHSALKDLSSATELFCQSPSESGRTLTGAAGV